MAKEKAHSFLEHLMKNPDLLEKMKGFSVEELKEAAQEKKKSGELSDESAESYTL